MEKRIINSLLTFKEHIKLAYNKLTPEMFKDNVCRDAYTFIIRNFELGKENNLVDLIRYLTDEYYTQEEAQNFLSEVMEEKFIGKSDIQSAIDEVVNTYKGEQLKELVDSLSFTSKGIKHTIVELNKRTEELLKDTEPKGRSVKAICEEFATYYGKEHEMGIRTGFYDLDEILNGLNKGDITILGARPAVGKSALATQILTNVVEKGHRVGYFNLEMTDQQILERMVCRYSGIDLTRLKRAIKFMEDEELRFCKAMEQIRQMKGLYIFSGSYTASEMKLMCKNQDFDLIVIDYLQLVRPDKNYGNRVAEVGDVSKSIKAMAMELKVPIIALSQLNRKKGATDEPEIADLRESGDIEQDASNVLLMWNMDNEGKTKGLKVEKNRQGELGKIALRYEGGLMTFKTINYKSFSQVEKECNRPPEDFNPFK